MGSSERDLPFDVGQIVAGRYRILRLLGRGGMGAIFEAEHTELQRLVALKVLLPRLAADPDAVTRFLREARAAAAIGHPGIVQVFDLDSRDDVAFLAMERLQGEELAQCIKRLGPLPAGFVARVGRDLADAVAAAHDCGIVHRDLKPQNVFLARDARGVAVVKVLDFGIAKLTEGDRADQPLTRTGAVFGTPMYMPPEQLHGVKDLDGRADIYAIGAILYECLTGEPPFAAESFPLLVLRITTEPPRPIRAGRPDAPPELVAVIGKALAKAREDRYATAHELADALGAIAAAHPEPPLPPPPAEPPPSREDLASAATVPSQPARAPGPGQIPPTQAGATVSAKGPPDAPAVAAATVPAKRVRGPVPDEPVAEVPAGTPMAWSSLPPPAPRARRVPRLALGAALLVVAAASTALWLATPARHAATPPAPKPPSIVRLRSSPPGAEIRLGGALLCKTPCDRPLPETEAADLSARLAGYAPARTVLSPPLPAEYTFVLTAAEPVAAPPPEPPPPPIPTPGPTPTPRTGNRKLPPTGPALPPLRNR